MYSHTTKVRVRYAETDQMGYVYYGNYATYFEVARVEALRALGISYKSLEERGIMMPVLELKTKFIRPARYDEELAIKLTIAEVPATRMRFTYEVFNEKEELINVAETTLVFVDGASGRPVAADPRVVEALAGYFSQ